MDKEEDHDLGFVCTSTFAFSAPLDSLQRYIEYSEHTQICHSTSPSLLQAVEARLQIVHVRRDWPCSRHTETERKRRPDAPTQRLTMTTTDRPAGGLVEPKKDGASGSAGGTMGGCVGGRGMSVAMVVSCSVVVGAGGLACDETSSG